MNQELFTYLSQNRVANVICNVEEEMRGGKNIDDRNSTISYLQSSYILDRVVEGGGYL